jgi:hypothetical protein
LEALIFVLRDNRPIFICLRIAAVTFTSFN